MTGTWLTADLGNTRCKLSLWRCADGGRPERASHGEFDSPAPESPCVAAWLARAQAQTRTGGVSLSSVVEPALERRWIERLAGAFPSVRVTLPDAGLEIDCRQPELVGRDRLFAARGALEWFGGSTVVVDAGTALTVDAVRLAAGAARGTFLGGAIAPGPALLARALARGGARLFEVEPRTGVPALGKDTEAALRAGIAVGFHGAARELVERISGESGLERAPVALTGGARAFLLDPQLVGGRDCVEIEDLVGLGLLAAAGLWRRP
jgi:type III pantothenate kinase